MRLLNTLVFLALFSGCIGGGAQTTTTTTLGLKPQVDSTYRDMCYKLAENEGIEAYRCYREAVLTKGVGICGDMVKPDGVFYCQAAAADDPVLCQGIDDDRVRVNCIIGFAEVLWNTSICEQMLIAPELDNYRSQCIMKVAMSRGDTSVCDSIEQQTYKDRCIKQIAEVVRDAGLCARISKDYSRGECILNVAVSTKNLSLCGNITSRLQRELCESYMK